MVGLFAYPMLYYAVSGLKIGYIEVLVISQIFCTTFSYATNKFLVFKTVGNYMAEYIKFISFHGVYFLMNIVGLWILVEKFNLSPAWTQFGLAGLIIITSYIWHSKITFKHRAT